MTVYREEPDPSLIRHRLPGAKLEVMPPEIIERHTCNVCGTTYESRPYALACGRWHHRKPDRPKKRKT